MDDFVTLTAAAERTEGVKVMLHALTSPMDAGHAPAVVSNHLLDSLQHERLATFHADELVNYRANRPQMVFDGWHFTQYDEPTIAIDLVRDDEGTAMLLLHGQEPDLKWERFVAVVMDVAERFGVETTVLVEAFPMGVPHTRPIQVTQHATDRDLLGGRTDVFGTLQVPAKVGSLLEYRLGQAGRRALALTAAVPHYLAQNPDPRAAAALVRAVADATGLALPVGELEAAAARLEVQLNEQVASQGEVQAVVAALEKQYDSFVEERPQLFSSVPGADVPTADEIGAAAEAFLADRASEGHDGTVNGA